MSYFNLNWVLANDIAIGPAPRKKNHLEILKENNISSILSLCSINEIPQVEGASDCFVMERVVLPDHTYQENMNVKDIRKALDSLSKLRRNGAVYVHCVAAVERAPMICMAWLINSHKLTPEMALDYLMQVHPGTNPLPKQLRLLKDPLLKNQ